mmetsp:Transcript_19792/g.36481  ORF Transcript_19792/g.36481 Transcript_19792/m.36481 type:complete len:161 (+) Transcript_19792:6987-7469(+)
METVRSLLVCVAQQLARDMHEILKGLQNLPLSERKATLIEHCNQTRSLLKRVKKVISWARTSGAALKRSKTLRTYLIERARMTDFTVNSLARVAEQQRNSLRTAPFAMETAAELLCTGGYVSFPKFVSRPVKTKISMENFEKLLKHKALLTDKADKVTQR